MPIDRITLSEMPDGLRRQLEPRVARLGYLGGFFGVAAHQPQALSSFIGFTEALKAALPARTVEIIALTVASLTGNDYERVQHERLALTIGMRVDEIRSVISGTVLAPPFTPDEALSATVATQMVHGLGQGASGAVAQLAEVVGDTDAVAVVLTASRYLAHAAAANAWQLEPPVPSPLATEPSAP